jgi:hypothetical protein
MLFTTGLCMSMANSVIYRLRKSKTRKAFLNFRLLFTLTKLTKRSHFTKNDGRSRLLL